MTLASPTCGRLGWADGRSGSDEAFAGREAPTAAAGLELWGGVECSVVRIGDEWRDQLRETGHDRRAGDLELVAELGLATMRYPVLWERVAPDAPNACDWGWSDFRLGRLRALGMRPIVGLVHHGAGPRYTDLLDPAFPDLLADYALRVAARYPWVEAFTPVNEPLTTARFSGLYGHWHPHRRDYPSFLRALVNQCLATARAMRAIRSVNPAARLVQTEDLGKTFSTRRLAYQAEHENMRRWLSLDLLCGRVDRDHPWRGMLTANGVGERALDELVETPCSPDVMGFNHYLTSERYLDERRERYSPATWGGNGRDRYADVEANRIEGLGDLGPLARLREAWARYRIPLAITEAHNGSVWDEQLRWLIEMWRAASTGRGEGIDVRAVTAWALFGGVDWDSLLTCRRGRYEVGAFDAKDEPPSRTALADAIAALAAGREYEHPALETPGWWRRPDRFFATAAA